VTGEIKLICDSLAKHLFLSQVRIDLPLYPTPQQEARCFILCQSLTALLIPINVFRLDERQGNVFILGGEDIAIVVTRDGGWRFE
jgi:hypothetical protein